MASTYTVVNLILKKISTIGATRCQILRLKCTKLDFGWGSAQTPLAELTAPLQRSPSPLDVFKGPASKGKERGREEGKGKEREGKGRTTLHTPCRKFLATPLHVSY